MFDWTYIANLLPRLFYIPSERRKDFIFDQKRRMLGKMLEEHPARVYEAICFETKSNECEIYEGIENHFKRADGQYIYNGEFVSREFLWEHHKNLPCRIKMTVYVREENLEDE